MQPLHDPDPEILDVFLVRCVQFMVGQNVILSFPSFSNLHRSEWISMRRFTFSRWVCKL